MYGKIENKLTYLDVFNVRLKAKNFLVNGHVLLPLIAILLSKLIASPAQKSATCRILHLTNNSSNV